MEVFTLDAAAAAWIGEKMSKFETLAPQVADVSLLYVAQRTGIRTVFTLDRRDFSAYRLDGGEALRIEPAY